MRNSGTNLTLDSIPSEHSNDRDFESPPRVGNRRWEIIFECQFFMDLQNIRDLLLSPLKLAILLTCKALTCISKSIQIFGGQYACFLETDLLFEVVGNSLSQKTTTGRRLYWVVLGSWSVIRERPLCCVSWSYRSMSF